MDSGQENLLLSRSLSGNTHCDAPDLIRGPGLQANPFPQPWVPHQVRDVALLVGSTEGSSPDLGQYVRSVP